MIAAKAVIGCLIAFVGALAAGAADGGVTLAEWLVAAGSGLTALGAVYQIPNKTGEEPRR